MMMKFLNMFLVATAIIFLMNMHQHEAGRVFNGDRNLMENECLLLGSLSGPSTNPTPNPPTYIPGPTKAKVSTINSKNFAGHTQPPPRHPPSGPLMDNEYLLLGSLSGPSTNPTPNPPTHIPGPTKAKVSTINPKNFAGHTQPPPCHPPCGPLMDNKHLLLGSLPHGPIIPSPSSGTHIPSPSKAKASTINPKNFAGHSKLPPPSPPRPFSTTKQLLFVMAIGRK